MASDDLKGVFDQFTKFGSDPHEGEIDQSKFQKMMRDLKVLDKKLTSTDVDIIFNKCKDKSERTLTYEQFSQAVTLLAEKKYGNKDGRNELIGLLTRGKELAGPTKSEKAGVTDQLTDRPTNTSKYGTALHEERHDESGEGKGLEGRADFDHTAKEGYVGGSQPDGQNDVSVTSNYRTRMASDDLKSVFNQFTIFGSKTQEGEIDQSKFQKMMRDLKVLDKELTSTDVDIIFNKCKDKSERTLTYEQFSQAVTLLAEKKYGNKDGRNELIGLLTRGKELAGPTKSEKAGVTNQLTDRPTNTSKYGTALQEERHDESGEGKGLEGRADFDHTAKEGYVGGSQPDGQNDVSVTSNYRTRMASDDLKSVFNQFTIFGSKTQEGEIDQSKFQKMMRDLKVLDKELTSTDVDIIFNKCKDKSERTLTYEQFSQAVTLLAEKKYGNKDGRNELIGLLTRGKELAGPTKSEKAGVTDQLTDRPTNTSKYGTALHEERHDESGEGKGLEGRADFDHTAKDGYVGGYQPDGQNDVS